MYSDGRSQAVANRPEAACRTEALYPEADTRGQCLTCSH